MRKSHITLLAGLMALATTVIVVDMADAGGRRGQRHFNQHPGGQDMRPGRADRAEALGLTGDQQAQMQALHETFRDEAEALRESLVDADRDARREAFQALRESHREQMQALLTDEQNAQLEAFHAERQANGGKGDRRRGHRPGARGEGRGAGERPDLSAALGLSEEQAAQMQSLRAEHREQMQALRASGEGSREQAQALRQAHREQVQSLLTDAQRATLEELRAAHPRGPRVDEQEDASQTSVDGASKAAASVQGRSWGSVKSGRR